MKRQFISAGLMFGVAMVVACGSRQAHGVDPNALESAYWRFDEDGRVAGERVPAGGNGANNDTVIDSLNENHMEAFNEPNAPLYINDNLPPAPLRDGVANTLAWKVEEFEVDGVPGGQDVYSSSEDGSRTMINNGIVGGQYNHDKGSGDPNGTNTPNIASPVTGFTLEAAFNAANLNSFQGIIAKEGRPGLEIVDPDDPNDSNPDTIINSLPTLGLKVRPKIDGAPEPDEGKLQIELFDQSGALKSVTSAAPVAVNQWYYAAVVNDGTTLSLYLNHGDGNGYQLEGSTTVDGALFQGLNPDDSSWDRNWTIGRLVYGGYEDNGIDPHEGGRPSDWFTGFLDEIRLTNEALDPSQFLFTQNGDLDANGVFDGRDFLAWQRGFGSIFDAQDLADWSAHFGPGEVPALQGVPEPAALSMAAIAALATLRRRRSA